MVHLWPTDPHPTAIVPTAPPAVAAGSLRQDSTMKGSLVGLCCPCSRARGNGGGQGFCAAGILARRTGMVCNPQPFGSWTARIKLKHELGGFGLRKQGNKINEV